MGNQKTFNQQGMTIQPGYYIQNEYGLHPMHATMINNQNELNDSNQQKPVQLNGKVNDPNDLEAEFQEIENRATEPQR